MSNGEFCLGDIVRHMGLAFRSCFVSSFPLALKPRTQTTVSLPCCRVHSCNGFYTSFNDKAGFSIKNAGVNVANRRFDIVFQGIEPNDDLDFKGSSRKICLSITALIPSAFGLLISHHFQLQDLRDEVSVELFFWRGDGS